MSEMKSHEHSYEVETTIVNPPQYPYAIMVCTCGDRIRVWGEVTESRAEDRE